MSFPYNAEKALQAINVVLQQEAEQNGTASMDYLRLLKLLYIADRESLKETGSPIIGDEIYAMDHGPVLTEVYEAMHDRSRFPIWKHFIEREGDRVKLSKDPGGAKLNQYDVEKLKGVTKRFSSTGTWKLVEHTHTFPEWQQHFKKGTSTPIPLGSILKALGFAEEHIEKIERAARSLSHARQVLR